LHVFRQDQPGQVRGVSWFAPVLLTAHELSQLLDAALVGQKVSAMMAGFLIDQNQVGGTPFEGTQQGSILTGGLEPGTIKILPSGFDIKFTSPQQVSTGIDLAKLNIRAIAAGLGLPEHVVSGDLSQANYSSLRAGLVQWKRRLEQIQFHVLVPQLLTPIWRRWLTLEILANRIDAPGFAEDPASWLSVEWYPPPLDWVDSEKDAKAEAELIAAGLTGLQDGRVSTHGWADVGSAGRNPLVNRPRKNFATSPFATLRTPNRPRMGPIAGK
jgi:lambda family phage portal protein